MSDVEFEQDDMTNLSPQMGQKRPSTSVFGQTYGAMLGGSKNPGLTGWLMRLGIAKNVRQANYILMVFVVLFFLLSFYFFFGGLSQTSHNPAKFVSPGEVNN